MLDAVRARSRAHPIPFAHWYVDGGNGVRVTDTGLTCVSYTSLAPLRLAVLRRYEQSARPPRARKGCRNLLSACSLNNLDWPARLKLQSWIVFSSVCLRRVPAHNFIAQPLSVDCTRITEASTTLDNLCGVGSAAETAIHG